MFLQVGGSIFPRFRQKQQSIYKIIIQNQFILQIVYYFSAYVSISLFDRHYQSMSILKNNKDAKIVGVFQIRANGLVKFNKYKVPIIFSVSLKKNTDLVYCKYDDLRAQNPLIILEYFEKTAQFHLDGEPNLRPLKESPQAKKPQASSEDKRYNKYTTASKTSNRRQSKQSRQSRQHREVRSPIKQKRQIKELYHNNQENYISYPAAVVQKKQVKEEEIYDINKFNKYITEHQSRPVRSCRMKGDYTKASDHYEYQGSSHRDIVRNTNTALMKYEQPSQQEEEQAEEEDVQQNAIMPIYEYVSILNKRQSVILDYDTYLQEKGHITLISPAVIPSIKNKNEIMQKEYMAVPFNIIKQIQREPFSSQEFHDIDQSQFILDQRGKERRRRQKMFKQQQRHLNKKKKIKKFHNKKKKSSY